MKDLEKFHDDLTLAELSKPEGSLELPTIEAKQNIIEHFNKGKMSGFEKAGYFVFKGVKVCAEGTTDKVSKQDKMTSNDKLFGKGY